MKNLKINIKEYNFIIGTEWGEKQLLSLEPNL